MPDFFDRLLARHAVTVPGAARAVTGTEGEGDRAPVRLRPRLPGPFERIETLGAPDDVPPVEPALRSGFPAPRPVPRQGEPVRIERETRTEHRTVVRTAIPPGEAAAHHSAEPPPAAPLLRPAAPVSPAPRPAASEPRRRGPREPGPAHRAEAPPRTAAAAVLPPDPAAAPAAQAATPLRPRADEASAAREAARATVGRRRSREAERVVHVQIGRLEVSAGSSRPRRGQAPATGRAGRAAPEMSLQDYLSRGERRD